MNNKKSTETTLLSERNMTIGETEKGVLSEDFARPIVIAGAKKRLFSNPLSFTNWTGVPWPLAFYTAKLRGARDESAIPSAGVLNETLPVKQPPDFPTNDSTTGLSATWLGHATVFVRLDGVSFITDPVWATELSPVAWLKSFFRYRPPPAAIQDLPPLDFGVISHSHYDHLDTDAVRAISARFPAMRWFVPEGLKPILVQEAGVSAENVEEMSWGERKTVTFGEEKKQVDIWCLPAQHWSQRKAFDRFTTLWSGWAVVGPRHRFYFPGDTGFCEDEFRKIGARLGPFDLAAIPIGCFKPSWLMRAQHISPEEAVKVHKLVRARQSIGIHWGTYQMGAFERYMEPREALTEALEREGLAESGQFTTIGHGETWTAMEIDEEAPSKTEGNPEGNPLKNENNK